MMPDNPGAYFQEASDLMTRLLIAVTLILFAPVLLADDPVFSGPQVGEKLPPLKVRGVFDADAGKEFDFVKRAEGKPIVLVFVHEMNRPSMGLTRTLSTYTASRAKDGLHTGIVWLSDDATEAENTLKRIRYALAKDAPIGISTDGKEGPGAYGLNRNTTLTILVGKEGKVTANFALVQPSLQADLPKILKEVVRVAGGEMPKLESLPGMKAEQKERATGDPKLPGLLRAVIQKTASKEDVDKAASAVERYVKVNDAARKEVGRIARTIIEGGKLDNYGTAPAREYLRKWAKEYGSAKDEKKRPGKDGGRP
jgi:hypothetical protein